MKLVSGRERCLYPFPKIEGSDDDNNHNNQVLQNDLERPGASLFGYVIAKSDNKGQSPYRTDKNGNRKRQQQGGKNKGQGKNKLGQEREHRGFPYFPYGMFVFEFLGDVDAQRVGKGIRNRYDQYSADNNQF